MKLHVDNWEINWDGANFTALDTNSGEKRQLSGDRLVFSMALRIDLLEAEARYKQRLEEIRNSGHHPR